MLSYTQLDVLRLDHGIQSSKWNCNGILERVLLRVHFWGKWHERPWPYKQLWKALQKPNSVVLEELWSCTGKCVLKVTMIMLAGSLNNRATWNDLFCCCAAKFQWSALQIDQGSFIYIHDVILGWVYDIISHLVCILNTFLKLEYLRN